MLETITSVNGVVNGIVWGPVGLALLFGTGFVMSVRTGFFQFGHFRYWLRNTIGAIFTDRDITAHTEKNDKAISQFQSLCTALAATIGTGNIVGVATAILSGGPGAIFWMWAMAILGMMTNYSENVLGIFYRRKNADGEWSGGAMYYLADGLGSKKGCKKLGRVLAVLFACFCVLASFGIGNMSQINSIAGNMNAAFQVPNLLTGILLAVLSALVILGGLKRVAAVTEKVVPLMALFYILGALTVVLTHITAIPAAFAAIFKGAFAMQAAGGGVLGYGVSRAITWGFKRGAFSNEAGLGSSVMVHASSNVKEPVQQGMWGIFEVFADTIVVCTLTALVILTSGFVDLNTGRMLTEVQGSALVGEAFSTVFGSFGPKFIAVSILLFAYSTVLGWSHYGTKAFEYLFGTKASMGYKVVFVAMVLVGATMKLDLAWDLSDTFNGLMMLPNLIGVLSLSGTVAAITRNYVDRKFHGKQVEPMWSAFAEYQKEEEAEEAILNFFRLAVRSKKSIVIAGETGSGKTTFMKALMQEIPVEERILTIEDVPELAVGLPKHKNRVSLFYPAEGESSLNAATLIRSALRMKPDRILLAELRGAEAFDFLTASLTGHGGSITSCHAGSCAEAFEYLALRVMQSEAGSQLPYREIRRLLHLAVDIVVHIHASNGIRQATEIWYDPESKTLAKDLAAA